MYNGKYHHGFARLKRRSGVNFSEGEFSFVFRITARFAYRESKLSDKVMLLFFYGEETFRPAEKIRSLKKKFLKKNPSGAGLSEFDLSEDVDLGDLRRELSAVGLFTERRLVLVKDPFARSAEEQRVLRDIFAAADPAIVLAVWQRSLPRKQAVLFRYLLSAADRHLEFAPPKGVKLRRFLGERAREYGVSLSTPAAEELIAATGEDLFALDTRLAQAAAYVGCGGEITVETVRLFGADTRAGDIFSLAERLVGGEPATLTHLENFFISDGDGYRLLSLAAYQTRILLSVTDCFSAGLSDRYAIAKHCQIHPFVAGKAIKILSARRFSRRRLRAVLRRLAEIDLAVKTGRTDIERGLFSLACLAGGVFHRK